MSNFDINISGGASIRLLTAGKYCDKDIVITAEDPGEGGVQLPELENAATASDIVAGKQAIDADGNVVEGTLYEVKSDGGYSALSDLQIQYIEGKENSFISIEPKIAIKGNVMDDLVVRSGAEISTMFPAEEFGDAGAFDVLFGRTFTSKNGVKMVGSYVFDVRPYLPKLENPATSNDILLNKESIDAEGNKVVGTYEPYELPSLRFPATDADIMFGKEAIDAEGNGIIGSMPINAAKEKTLRCGASYTIPAGYHDGNGKIVVSSLSNQTIATATEADIAAGKTAWVNGVKLTGTAQMGGGVETVNVTFTIYGNGTIYYMGADGMATLTSPYEQTVAVVKDSPVIIIYDGSTTLILQYGSGYTQHYDNAWSYSGHSCSVLSFYEDGNVLYAES
jgi:hypothetical protein